MKKSYALKPLPALSLNVLNNSLVVIKLEAIGFLLSLPPASEKRMKLFGKQ